MKFTDITSHEQACVVLGKDFNASENIHQQLDDIADAINKTDNYYVADFKNSERKWRPYFIVDASGFRFVLSFYGDSFSSPCVGSRLCFYFRTEEIANYFGIQFLKLHEKCFFRPTPPKDVPMSFNDIKTHEDACRVIQIDPSQSTTTDQKITDICKAINRLSGFKPDFNNEDQLKWRPFFRMDVSGFRFAFSGCDDSFSGAIVGSRLCHHVGTEAEANHLGVHFLELHKEHYFG